MVYVCHYSKIFQNLTLRELNQDHSGSSRIKSLAHSHLWWPRLELDLEKLAKSSNWDEYCGWLSTYFCSVWITRASSVRQRSTVHL